MRIQGWLCNLLASLDLPDFNPTHYIATEFVAHPTLHAQKIAVIVDVSNVSFHFMIREDLVFQIQPSYARASLCC